MAVILPTVGGNTFTNIVKMTVNYKQHNTDRSLKIFAHGQSDLTEKQCE